MYNSEQKIRFIRAYTSSIHTANVAATIFQKLAAYEEAWDADLCTRSAEELQPVINEIVGLRLKSRWMSMSILREYTKWCMLMDIPGACDGMLHVTFTSVDKVRRQMVANPYHLQKYLDEIFDKESKKTIDNLYRCYYWMAYGGISEKDTLTIRKSDVDLEQMIIHYGNTSVPIYREALPAFQNVLQLDYFVYLHPRYEEIERERVPGDLLLRGIKAMTKTMTIRTTLSRKSAAALESKKTEMQLSFQRISLSGLFFRVYEQERAGVKPDFTEAAIQFMGRKEYTSYEQNVVEHRMKQIIRNYIDDYQRWKLAFSM